MQFFERNASCNKACFIRRNSVALNAIQTIESSHYVLIKRRAGDLYPTLKLVWNAKIKLLESAEKIKVKVYVNQRKSLADLKPLLRL